MPQREGKERVQPSKHISQPLHHWPSQTIGAFDIHDWYAELGHTLAELKVLRAL